MEIRTHSYNPLSQEELFQAAPAIFATAPDSRVSEAYQFVSTWDIIQELAKHDIVPVAANQVQSIKHSMDHGSHTVRFRHASQLKNFNKQGIVEIGLGNSHDRSKRLRWFQGMYRLVCSNGLVALSNQLTYSGKHNQLTMDDVIDSVAVTINQTNRVVESSKSMMEVKLTDDDKLLMAQAARIMLYGEDSPIPATGLLQVRRDLDKASDLWTVFNVIQENVTKGGVRYSSLSGRPLATRPITAIDRNLDVNERLWELADEMYKLAA